MRMILKFLIDQLTNRNQKPVTNVLEKRKIKLVTNLLS